MLRQLRQGQRQLAPLGALATDAFAMQQMRGMKLFEVNSLLICEVSHLDEKTRKTDRCSDNQFYRYLAKNEEQNVKLNSRLVHCCSFNCDFHCILAFKKPPHASTDAHR
jgi:hypothetical protein